MEYVILINEDNSLYGSQKRRIMQRSKLVDDLIFIVNPIYRNTHDMSNATVLLEYVLPVSRKYETVYLELCEERYKDCFLQYKLPFDVNLTSEAGSVELQLTFAWTELSPQGKGIQRVRKTSSTFIDIVSITAWSDIVPDSALSALDQRIIKLDASMRAMNDYIDVLENQKVDNLTYNDADETLYLTSKGSVVGDKVNVRDMLNDGIPVVDLDSTSGGSGSVSNNNCGHDDCDCHDNVVEFGYTPGTNVPEKPEDDDGNVVEF